MSDENRGEKLLEIEDETRNFSLTRLSLVVIFALFVHLMIFTIYIFSSLECFAHCCRRRWPADDVVVWLHHPIQPINQQASVDRQKMQEEEASELFSSSSLLFFLQSTVCVVGEMRPDDKFHGKERKIVLQMDNCSFGALITTSKKRKNETQQAIVHRLNKKKKFSRAAAFYPLHSKSFGRGPRESSDYIWTLTFVFNEPLHAECIRDDISHETGCC